MEVITNIKTDQYAGRFNLWKRKTAQGFIEMGKVIVDAKENLDKGEFEEFIGVIGYATASSFISKLYQIGMNADLFDKNIDQLPSSYTTLYQLTTVDSPTLVKLFDQQLISPALKGRQLEEMVKRQKRYRITKPERKVGPVEYIEINEPLQRLEPIELRIDSTFPPEYLPQFLRQLELLTKRGGVKVSIPASIHQQINKPGEIM